MMIPGNTVQLEAQLKQPQGKPRGAVVLCHPHPLYGGTMDNRVVYRAAKAAVDAGFASLRFNFRGVGNSTGQYDQGMGEKEDVAAALEWLGMQYPDSQLGLIGYSFGAWVGLQIACDSQRVQTIVGIGLPLNLYSLDYLTEYKKPALYIVGTEDEFCSQENLDKLAKRLPNSSSVSRIKDADHFFTDHIEIVQNLITDFFKKHST
jgi:alpha/beta superfamily hydrolase